MAFAAVNVAGATAQLQRFGLHDTLANAEERFAEQQPEWAMTRPSSCVVPGARSVMLRHGRVTYTLLDDSPESLEANEADERPVVVLIAGLGFWSFVWTKLANSLIETKRCKAVLTYDRYGRGTSDVAVNPNTGDPVRHSPDLFAQQLDDLLVAVSLRSGKMLKKEGRLVVAGTSMGGMIAMQYAAVTPQLVKRLVLMAPACLKEPPAMASLDVKCLKVWGLGQTAWAMIGESSLLKMLHKNQLSEDVPNLAKDNPQLLANLMGALEWQIKCKPGCVWDYYRDLTQMPWGGLQEQADAIGGHSYPVVLLWGSEDPTTPIANAAEFQNRIPRAQLTTLEGAAHSPYLMDEHIPAIVDAILPPGGV